MAEDYVEAPGPQALALQQTLDSSWPTLELVAKRDRRATRGWLRPAAESEEGTEELFGLLEDRVAQPGFAEELAAQRRAAQQTLIATAQSLQPPPAAAAEQPGEQAAWAGPGSNARGEVLQRDWWELRPDGNTHAVVAEATGEYIVVEKEDVVDALSQFIAAYLSSLPEARELEPRQLQRAIADTLKEMRKGRVRRLMDWGRVLYRVGAAGYGAFSVFSNPWLAQAVLAALWTFVKAVGRLAW